MSGNRRKYPGIGENPRQQARGARVGKTANHRDVETGDSALAVYDGRHMLGEIFDLGCRVAAQLADGTDLGTFPNNEAARQAIIGAQAGRRP